MLTAIKNAITIGIPVHMIMKTVLSSSYKKCTFTWFADFPDFPTPSTASKTQFNYSYNLYQKFSFLVFLGA